MTFPYSHMSRDELISRAELEGDALAKALARELDDVRDEIEGYQADVRVAEEKQEEAEDEVSRLKDELGALVEAPQSGPM